MLKPKKNWVAVSFSVVKIQNELPKKQKSKDVAQVHGDLKENPLH